MNMVEQGEAAPDIRLPGIVDGTTRTFSLQAAADRGQAVLLIFYPFDFSPVCTTELCAIQGAEWLALEESLEVWAISGDSVYAHEAFADEYNLTFPLLSDSDGEVAGAYDVQYDEWEGHACVPKRGVILVDTDQTVRYVWKTDNALEKPDFFPVKTALDELLSDGYSTEPEELDLAVDYENSPGELR